MEINKPKKIVIDLDELADVDGSAFLMMDLENLIIRLKMATKGGRHVTGVAYFE